MVAKDLPHEFRIARSCGRNEDTAGSRTFHCHAAGLLSNDKLLQFDVRVCTIGDEGANRRNVAGLSSTGKREVLILLILFTGPSRYQYLERVQAPACRI